MSEETTPLVAVSEQGGVLLLDIAAAQLSAVRVVDRFDGEFRGLVEQRTEKFWVLDFRNVTFLVTPAVNTLLWASKKLRARQGDLALCGLSPAIRRLFGLMKLDRVFLICESAEEAQQRFRAGRPGPARSPNAG